MLPASLSDPWNAIFSNTFSLDVLASLCTLTSSFIEGKLAGALQRPILHNNRMNSLLHTGSGEPLSDTGPTDKETLQIVPGFKDQKSLSAYLAEFVFVPPHSTSRRKGVFNIDLFSPHSGSPEESTANCHCHLTKQRTPEAIRLLADIMEGKRPFASQIDPPNSGLIYVNRNVVYQTGGSPLRVLQEERPTINGIRKRPRS
jgi:hypothetical protein